MKRFLLFSLFLIICPTLLWAQVVSKVGTSAAPFLQIGAGSRASAFGEAYTAIPDGGATSIYWNPATLDLFGNNEVTFNYSDWIAGMKYFYTAGALHLGSVGSFGISVTSLTTPEMIVRTVEFPDGLGTRFDAADIAIGVTYAKKLTDRFSFGATFKYINRRIWEMNASAIAMDFGIFYQLPWKNVYMGISILNFGSKLQMQGVDAVVYTDLNQSMAGNNDQIMANLYTKQWDLPISFRFGISYKAIHSEYNSLIIAADFIHPNDNFASINVGGEYGFMDHFFLRAGYKSIGIANSQVGLTYGGGVKYQMIRFDYSYVKLQYLDYVDQFSVCLQF